MGRLPGTLSVMIPNADFERAIAQWKIRRQGGQVATQAEEVASGAVVGEMALANAEPGLLSGEIRQQRSDPERIRSRELVACGAEGRSEPSQGSHVRSTPARPGRCRW